MKRTKNIIVPVLLILFLFQLSSCSDISEQNNMSSYKNQLIDMKEFKDSIKNLINDTIWYHGDLFFFNKFENKTFEMILYIKKENSNVDSVFICMYPEEESYREEMGYTALIVMNGIRGFHNETSTYFDDDNKIDMIKQVEDQGYTFYCNDKLAIEKISEPDYQSFTDKEIIIQNIIEFIPQDLEQAGFTSGQYKAYIRDFRENDYRTYVVIDDKKGNTWIQKVGISDNGEAEVDKILDVNEGYKGLAAKYREAAVKEIDVTVQ